MKIVIFETEPREAPAFDSLKPGRMLELTAQPLRADNAHEYADAEIVSTFIYSALGRDVLAKLPQLKLVATRSTGYDHIDTRYCAEHGVTVCNVPTYGENTVAEHVFALLLAISHRLREAMERARSGRFTPDGLEGFDLQGKTLGVVGTGNIGRHVIRIARGFAMTVLAFDVKPQPALARDLGFTYAGMDDLLARSDIVTLHVPALPQTRHLIDAAAVARMKPGAILINTARGSVVELAAADRGAAYGQARRRRPRCAAGRAADPRGGGAHLLDLRQSAGYPRTGGRPYPAHHAQRHRHAAQRLQYARGHRPNRDHHRRQYRRLSRRQAGERGGKTRILKS